MTLATRGKPPIKDRRHTVLLRGRWGREARRILSPVQSELPEPMYVAIGRVTVAAVCVEESILDMLGRLAGTRGGAEKSRWARKPTSAVTARCRDMLPPFLDDGLRGEVLAWLDQVAAVLEHRHRVVHSRWLDTAPIMRLWGADDREEHPVMVRRVGAQFQGHATSTALTRLADHLFHLAEHGSILTEQVWVDQHPDPDDDPPYLVSSWNECDCNPNWFVG